MKYLKFRWVPLLGLVLMLSACISDFSPSERAVTLNPGETQTFQAASDDPKATLDWYLDGKKMSENQGAFVFTAEQLTGDIPATHLLAVVEIESFMSKLLKKSGLQQKISDAVKWKVIVKARVWGTAEKISSDDLGPASSPQIAMDAAGNAIAVWGQTNMTVEGQFMSAVIRANHFDGTSWGIPEFLQNNYPPEYYSLFPQIAMEAAGNAIAVWRQPQETWYGDEIHYPIDVIWANRFDGTSWGTAELLGTGFAGDANKPQIAMDAAGNAIAVWQQDLEYFPPAEAMTQLQLTDICAKRFDGTSWGTPELLENNHPLEFRSINPQIAMDAAGKAIAVWEQRNRNVDGQYTSSAIRANRFDGTSWGTPEFLQTDILPPYLLWLGLPQIAMDACGNAIAVWSPDGGIWANRFDGAAWGTAELIGTGPASSPQIAMDAYGNAIAVWNQDDGTGTNAIWASRFDGAAWGTAELIGTGPASSTQIAMVAYGNAIVVWEHEGSIWANRFE
ncbi:MAG: hypothetical protein WAU91_15480 [Desulfatitalea sp.]